jgi:hypothetical protein
VDVEVEWVVCVEPASAPDGIIEGFTVDEDVPSPAVDKEADAQTSVSIFLTHSRIHQWFYRNCHESSSNVHSHRNTPHLD